MAERSLAREVEHLRLDAGRRGDAGRAVRLVALCVGRRLGDVAERPLALPRATIDDVARARQVEHKGFLKVIGLTKTKQGPRPLVLAPPVGVGV